MSETSYRTILRSSSIIGGAQAVNVVINIAKIKILALLLGPLGVGLIGLYASIIQTGSTIAALGFGTVGTRQIAAANGNEDPAAVMRARRALFWGTLGLSLTGAAGVWLGRTPIAAAVFGDGARAGEVGWLALGVGLTVASGSQVALLTGLRRLGNLALLQVGAGFAGALLGVFAIWQWGDPGILAMVLVAPAASFVLGHLFVARLAKPAANTAGWREITVEIRAMAALGLAVMVSALATVAGQLIVRVIVQQQLGSDALGFFQAAWAISMTYLGFILVAMGTDYFPRLSAAMGSPEQAARLVNEQTEIGLLLCGPVLLAVLGLSPWVIAALYSPEFAPAVEVLRWQLLGDMLKVMSWPLGFVLLAAGAGKTFTLAETAAVAVFVAGTWAGLSVFGLAATGIAFLLMYAVYLPLVFWLANRRMRIRWSRAVVMQASALLGAAVLVDIAARLSAVVGGALGVMLAAAFGFWALYRIAQMAELGGKLAILARIGRKLRAWTTSRP
jgi:PST family polysaccharide transporter